MGRPLSVERERNVDDTKVGNVGMRDVNEHAQRVELSVPARSPTERTRLQGTFSAPRSLSHSTADFSLKRCSNRSWRTLRFATRSALRA